MTYKLQKNFGYLLFLKEKLTEVNYLKRLILQAHFLFLSLILIIIIAGCSKPHIKPINNQLLLNSELIGFIRDGITTREEVLLRLGVPSAQFEGEKILTYQLHVDQEGKWQLVAPKINEFSNLREWQKGTYSLVLVFNSDGVLRKHSLVGTK